MIKFKHKGDFKNTEAFFTKSLNFTKMNKLKDAADRCLERLKAATPVDSGLTAESWSYEIVKEKNGIVGIQFNNTNIQNGINVALLLEYGHTTPSGTWVEGRNYINPIITEEYNKILKDTWKEIGKL